MMVERFGNLKWTGLDTYALKSIKTNSICDFSTDILNNNKKYPC